jgi:aryl carrier-like protein
MTRTIIIGDVHGCANELRALIAKLGVSTDDHVVSVGDLLDKGPDSAGAVKVLRDLRNSGVQVTLVRGNHEESHERLRRNDAVTARSGKPNPMTRAAELREVSSSLSAEDVAFLETAVPLLHIPEHGAVVVHGGVLPTHTELPSDWSKVSGKVRRDLEKVYRVRFVTPDGDMVSLGEEADADRFWADRYDGRFGHVFFGHEPFHKSSQQVSFPHATGLDLGAVHGNLLAAAVLDSSGVQFVTVPAAKVFAKPFHTTPFRI